jgi:hypothetical protein
VESTELSTKRGPLHYSSTDAVLVHRVGYAPAPWDWTDWKYASTSGHFLGRWDDPDAMWRALYLGSTALACYLEVLAPLRPDPALAGELADIDVDDEDAARHPTVVPGTLAYNWCEGRRICSGRMTGRFVVPGHHESLPTLRQQFLQLARSCGCEDLDAGAIRDAKRELTQRISAWIYTLGSETDQPVDGIEYLSRHGDHLKLWAIYERGQTDSPSQVANRNDNPVTPDDPDLTDAMRIHRITWAVQET